MLMRWSKGKREEASLRSLEREPLGVWRRGRVGHLEIWADPLSAWVAVGRGEVVEQ
jgi:hypothetical protein